MSITPGTQGNWWHTYLSMDIPSCATSFLAANLHRSAAWSPKNPRWTVCSLSVSREKFGSDRAHTPASHRRHPAILCCYLGIVDYAGRHRYAVFLLWIDRFSVLYSNCIWVPENQKPCAASRLPRGPQDLRQKRKWRSVIYHTEKNHIILSHRSLIVYPCRMWRQHSFLCGPKRWYSLRFTGCFWYKR